VEEGRRERERERKEKTEREFFRGGAFFV